MALRASALISSLNLSRTTRRMPSGVGRPRMTTKRSSPSQNPIRLTIVDSEPLPGSTEAMVGLYRCHRGPASDRAKPYDLRAGDSRNRMNSQRKYHVRIASPNDTSRLGLAFVEVFLSALANRLSQDVFDLGVQAAQLVFRPAIELFLKLGR